MNNSRENGLVRSTYDDSFSSWKLVLGDETRRSDKLGESHDSLELVQSYTVVDSVFVVGGVDVLLQDVVVGQPLTVPVRVVVDAQPHLRGTPENRPEG